MTPVFAQTGSIKGRVTASDGRAVEFVSIMLKGTAHGTATNTSGKFEIKKMSLEPNSILFRFQGANSVNVMHSLILIEVAHIRAS